MFSTTTRILIRWAAGHVEVGVPGKESYIELRGVTDPDVARELGEEILTAHQGQRGTLAVTGHVFNSSQQPGVGFVQGDTLDGYPVQSINIGMDGEGFTTVTPELGDPLANRLAQLNRRLVKANVAVTSEYISPFPPSAQRGNVIDTTPPEFPWRERTSTPPVEN